MQESDTLAHGRTSTTGRTSAVISAVAVTVVLAVTAATLASSGVADRFLAKIRGQAPVEKYDALKDAPAETGPSWLPGDTTEVAVRTKKKGTREKVGSTRIDGLLPAGWSAPADCKRNTYVQPWDGGGDWPLSTDTRIFSCLDGEIEWNLFTKGTHVYLFRDAIRP